MTPVSALSTSFCAPDGGRTNTRTIDGWQDSNTYGIDDVNRLRPLTTISTDEPSPNTGISGSAVGTVIAETVFDSIISMASTETSLVSAIGSATASTGQAANTATSGRTSRTATISASSDSNSINGPNTTPRSTSTSSMAGDTTSSTTVPPAGATGQERTLKEPKQEAAIKAEPIFKKQRQIFKRDKHWMGTVTSTMPHKENANLSTPKDSATTEETDSHQGSENMTSQAVSPPKKPKTRKFAKTEKRPTPAMKKQLNHFTRRHKFVTEQSFGTYTTSQRRAFERDVYDYSRALGLAKSRAKASVLSARRLCGEEDYNSDDTRLDDDEMDDSSVILVSLPASTGPATSNLGRSFSATSPIIPGSSNPRRSGSEILPSVEIQETPTSDVGKSERNRKRAGESLNRGKKRMKTSEETLDPAPQEDSINTGRVAMPRTSPVELQRAQSSRRKSKGQNGQLTDIPNATDSAVQSQSDARVEIERPMDGGHSATDGERRAKTGKEEEHENSWHISKGPSSESRKAERKERKRQDRRQSSKLVPAENGESRLSTGATGDARNDEMFQTPLESTRQGVHRDGKSADEDNKPSRDQGMDAWARDLLRVQDAARRAKEERERAGMASDAEAKVQNQGGAASVNRKEQKKTKSKKGRKSDALSSTPTGFQSPMIQSA
ncbi:MAG: hypothetical protein Q9223_003877 [Gallowayella weberi]